MTEPEASSDPIPRRPRRGAPCARTAIYLARPGARGARTETFRPWPPSIFECVSGQGVTPPAVPGELARALERDVHGDRDPADPSRSIRMALSDPELAAHLADRLRSEIHEIRPDALVGLDLDGLLLATLVARSLLLPVRSMVRGRRPPSASGPEPTEPSAAGERDLRDARRRPEDRPSPERSPERILLLAGPLGSSEPLLRAREWIESPRARIPAALVFALPGEDATGPPGTRNGESKGEHKSFNIIELYIFT